MNELSAALERLEVALETLESAAEYRLSLPVAEADDEGASAESLAETEAALEALRAERDQLAVELAQVRADAAALEQVTDDVAGRLDGAIEGIKEVLEN